MSCAPPAAAANDAVVHDGDARERLEAAERARCAMRPPNGVIGGVIGAGEADASPHEETKPSLQLHAPVFSSQVPWP